MDKKLSEGNFLEKLYMWDIIFSKNATFLLYFLQNQKSPRIFFGLRPASPRPLAGPGRDDNDNDNDNDDDKPLEIARESAPLRGGLSKGFLYL